VKLLAAYTLPNLIAVILTNFQDTRGRLLRMLSDCHSPDRIRLPLRRMLNALCSGALQVRFMYAGYTPVIRDNPVSTTQSVATG
ncbi:hypothetical protein EA252_27340, partial [Escherichia coli]